MPCLFILFTVIYTSQLSTEYLPELWRVPGRIESTDYAAYLCYIMCKQSAFVYVTLKDDFKSILSLLECFFASFVLLHVRDLKM